jgi:hypothetical protein
MTLKYARNVAMNDVEIAWEGQPAATWQSGLTIDEVKDLLLDGLRIDAVPGSSQPVLRLNDVDGVLIRQSSIRSVRVMGSNSRAVYLTGTEAKVTADPGVAPVTVK